LQAIERVWIEISGRASSSAGQRRCDWSQSPNQKSLRRAARSRTQESNLEGAPICEVARCEHLTIMASDTTEVRSVTAQDVTVTDDALVIDLIDGRTISAPLAWYPRLLHGNPAERDNWRLVGQGEGIHWPDLDEDISVENVLLGKPSGESQPSFKRWIENRTS
jgi:hypothetical protein